mmetsp:Transcript_44509/g.172676  ORF Transcript_44509/g.172676 Transcript_44509/m.172676 type:complete len:85 (+) Transcript_44509:69-323(+)
MRTGYDQLEVSIERCSIYKVMNWDSLIFIKKERNVEWFRRVEDASTCEARSASSQGFVCSAEDNLRFQPSNVDRIVFSSDVESY